MTRQSKNAKKIQRAREFQAMHLKGQRGPKQTVKQHKKKNTWYSDRQAYYRRNERKSGGAAKGN